MELDSRQQLQRLRSSLTTPHYPGSVALTTSPAERVIPPVRAGVSPRVSPTENERLTVYSGGKSRRGSQKTALDLSSPGIPHETKSHSRDARKKSVPDPDFEMGVSLGALSSQVSESMVSKYA